MVPFPGNRRKHRPTLESRDKQCKQQRTYVRRNLKQSKELYRILGVVDMPRRYLSVVVTTLYMAAARHVLWFWSSVVDSEANKTTLIQWHVV